METYTLTFVDNIVVESSIEFFDTTIEPPEPADLRSIVVIDEKEDKEFSVADGDILVSVGVDGELDRIVESPCDESLVGQTIALRQLSYGRCCRGFCPCPR